MSALDAAAAALTAQSDAINAINVFPVPDGDTGTNMSLTMRAAADAAHAASTGAGDVLRAAARGALMGAKGNSGVILSQILAGLAESAGDATALDAAMLRDAFVSARDAAYRVVSKPKEGTILTAISAAAASRAGADAIDAWACAADEARAAVARTPELLPVLKEAGVVDAGAQGLSVLLDGAAASLRGEAPAFVASSLGSIDPAWLAATRAVHDHAGGPGFCTEFVISGSSLDAATVRSAVSEAGESVLVVGGPDVLRVHVHTATPDDVLRTARTFGAVSNEKVDDMGAQVRRLHSSQRPAAGVAVVAVASGDGLADLMLQTGAHEIVRGGQTMNPSAGDIREAIERTGAKDVIVLPNNKNIVLAARLAAEGIEGARVIETVSLPQGVAALVAFNEEAGADENEAAMREAIAGVRTAEVTLAARAVSISGVSVREGQPIGIVDGELAVAEDTIDAAVAACVALLLRERDDAVVTLYAGEGADDPDALAERLRDEFGVDVELVDGGQPHYPYLIGVE